MDFGRSKRGSVAGAGGRSAGNGLATGSVEEEESFRAGGKFVGGVKSTGAVLSTGGTLSDVGVSTGKAFKSIASFDPFGPMLGPDLLNEAGSLAILRASGRYQKQVKAHKTIHKSTEIAVILVKISPAFTPKALAPPAPPKAPVKPPPRPLCSKMIKTMKSEIRNKAGPKTYWESIAKGKNTAKNLLASVEKTKKDTNAN